MHESKYLTLAIQNNAIWCDTICRAHGLPGEFHEGYWIHQRPTPRYYPNLVTLSPASALNLQQAELAAFLMEKQAYGVSVKDSFADLDPAAFGFQQLFEAQWIMRPAPTASIHLTKGDLQWKQIVSEDELRKWEMAWSQAEVAAHERLFGQALLADADICFVAAYKGDQIVAGAIGNRTTGVVGLSNLFAPEQEAQSYWEGIVAMLASCYPGLPIVGYEQDESLMQALQAGFTTLGPLRVWVR
ncbi:hypothetical protein [Dictyobacter alpinus]|nr:hypothetical protein [Dictyobacter alpinus]